jgi:disease resistance protein RPM1
VCDAIGAGIGNNPSMDDMRKILLLSYHDLTPQLKTCLLYLSLFPEDYVTNKYRLISRWIAKGFVQQGDVRQILFEIGRSYFNELVERSLTEYVCSSFCQQKEGGMRKAFFFVLEGICPHIGFA